MTRPHPPVFPALSSLQQHVLRTLAYYDIFQYPLTAAEVHRFLQCAAGRAVVDGALTWLVMHGFIHQSDDLYALRSDAALFARRREGNREAVRAMPRAQRRAYWIAQFPFVRAVMASGSLSKGYMDASSDLDFFIVTAPNRVWIARMLLVIYKRLFLFNQHKNFCVNYFVDENHLEIGEKNLFTATELATVVPLCGAAHYHQLWQANQPLLDLFPNAIPRHTGDVPVVTSGWMKRLLERWYQGERGDRWNIQFMKTTMARWRKLYEKRYDRGDFDIAFKSNIHTSKNHPNHYQKKVMALYDEKLKDYAQRFDLTWHA